MLIIMINMSITLTKPSVGDVGWGGVVNANWDSISGAINATGGRNVIINGLLNVWQRGTSAVSMINGKYLPCDRFQYNKFGTMVQSAAQSADVPTQAQAGVRLLYSLYITTTTAQASLSGTQYCYIRHGIEGYAIEYLAGRQCTLSFWVKAALIGPYCIALRNYNWDRSYVAAYTVVTANTWEKKVITFTMDTLASGTWNTTNGLGLEVLFTIASGGSSTTAGTWQSGNFICVTGSQTNGVSATTNDLRIAGIQFELGPADSYPEFEDIGTTLAKCLRYYNSMWSDTTTFFGNGSAVSTTSASVLIPLSVQMRSLPVLGAATSSASSFVMSDLSASPALTALSLDAGKSSRDNVVITGTTSGGLTAFRPYYLQGISSSIRLDFDAEI